MRALLLASLLTGCIRSDLSETQSVDCGEGTRVVVDYTVYCVLDGGECPAELPNGFGIANNLVCAEADDVPEAALLAAARAAAPDVGFANDASLSTGGER